MSAHAKIQALWSKKEKSDPKRHLGRSCPEPFNYIASRDHIELLAYNGWTTNFTCSPSIFIHPNDDLYVILQKPKLNDWKNSLVSLVYWSTLLLCLLVCLFFI